MSILPVSSEDEIITSNLLGPFRFIVKFTLLDCSYKSKCVRVVACLIALILVILMFARVGKLMQTDGNVSDISDKALDPISLPVLIIRLSRVKFPWLCWNPSGCLFNLSLRLDIQRIYPEACEEARKGPDAAEWIQRKNG